MAEVLMKLPAVARGQMATKLLEAAAELGLEPGVIRSQSEGFKVPEEVHRYLFPSEYNEDGTPAVPADPDIPASSTPAEDFGDLTEAELEELTDPNAQKE